MSTEITFKPLCEDDLVLLHQWFHKPHIKQWYARGESFTFAMIAEKYLPRIRNPNNIPNYFIYLDGNPIGYIQLYHLSYGLPDGVKDRSHSLFHEFKPEEIAGIDLFIAEEKYLGSGISSNMLATFIRNYIKGKFKAVVSDPVVQNTRAISYFEKNGFKRWKQDADNLNQLMLY
jgi:aminoglycoside 6'-N-acetyltransferase